jgi:hypothetical protein
MNTDGRTDIVTGTVKSSEDTEVTVLISETEAVTLVTALYFQHFGVMPLTQ